MEVLSNSEDFIDDIFEADNITSNWLFNDLIWLEMNSFIIDLSESLFVDQLADCFLWWLSPGDIVFDGLEHWQYDFGDLDEYSRVDFSQSEFVENNFLLFRDILHTSDSDHNEEIALCLGNWIVFFCGMNFFILFLVKAILEVYSEHMIFVEICIPWWIFQVPWSIRLCFSFCSWGQVYSWSCSWRLLDLFYVSSWYLRGHIAFWNVRWNLYSGSRFSKSYWFCSVIEW